MRKTLISAAVLSATMSAASYASQTGDAIKAYDENNDYEIPAALAMAPDTVFDTVAQGAAAPIDTRLATVISIPGALAAACSGGDPSCAASFPDIVVGAATSVTDPSDVDGGQTPTNPIDPAEEDEAPLNISGTVAPAQDACSVQMPASVDFEFSVSRSEVDGVAAGAPKTFDSIAPATVNFTCGEDRSEPLVVSFSTVDDEANKSASVNTEFTSNYHATNGDVSTLEASVVFVDGGGAATDKTLTNTGTQSVDLKAQVTLSDAQAKGGSFASSDATLYVYIN